MKQLRKTRHNYWSVAVSTPRTNFRQWKSCLSQSYWVSCQPCLVCPLCPWPAFPSCRCCRPWRRRSRWPCRGLGWRGLIQDGSEETTRVLTQFRKYTEHIRVISGTWDLCAGLRHVSVGQADTCQPVDTCAVTRACPMACVRMDVTAVLGSEIMWLRGEEQSALPPVQQGLKEAQSLWEERLELTQKVQREENCLQRQVSSPVK